MSTDHGYEAHTLIARQTHPPTHTADITMLRGLLEAAQLEELHPWRLDTTGTTPGPLSGTDVDDVIVHGSHDRENPLYTPLGRALAVAAVNALPALLGLAEAAYVERASGKPVAVMTAEVRALNTAKGWRDPRDTFPTHIALLHTEPSEALEAFRDRRLQPYTRADGKPDDVGAELADTLIRLLDICDIYGIDLAAQFERVMAWGWTRPYQHGGRTVTGDLPAPDTQELPACASVAGDLCTGPADTIVIYRSRLTGNETGRTEPMCTGHADRAHRAWNTTDNLAVVAVMAAAPHTQVPA